MNDEILVNELKNSGQIKANGIIGYSLAGEFLGLSELLDKKFVEMAENLFNAEKEEYTSVISKTVLDKIRYFEKFPDLIADVCIPGRNMTNQMYVLNPSTCYHTFSNYQNVPIAERLKVITAKEKCFRNEAASENPMRLNAFTMREIIFIGEKSEVRNAAECFFNKFSALIMSFGIEGEKKNACDIFYGANAKILKKFQIAQALKKEFCIPIRAMNGENIDLACMSRNYHQGLFINTFKIAKNRQNMESACVAIGVERLTYAVREKLGIHALKIVRG